MAEQISDKAHLIFRTNPVESHASLGCGQVAVQIVAGLVRSNKMQLETRLKCKLKPNQAIVQHLPSYVAWCYNRFVPTRADKRTPYERLTLKVYDHPVAQYGEKVMLKCRPEGKMNAKWQTGFWIGKSMTTDEHLVIHVF